MARGRNRGKRSVASASSKANDPSPPPASAAATPAEEARTEQATEVATLDAIPDAIGELPEETVQVVAGDEPPATNPPAAGVTLFIDVDFVMDQIFGAPGDE